MNKKIVYSLYVLIIVSLIIHLLVYINNKTGVFHKNPYKEQIALYSQKYSIDPLLVDAVMKRESNLNPNAVSNKGAIGLMQIMPKTAQEIAGQFDMPDYTPEMLKNPELNIMFGSYYLSQLMSYYNKNLILVLAAYNAGIGNVDNWLLQNPDIAKKISKIPFKETQKHTKAILITYNFYKGADKLRNLLIIKKA
ncbi:MAG: lytic transglycosylase domain-containing protein [Endomicrobia bacterium]|nr:lytic transglycosylase domain-containing protein [Endomicrobiia bacterium]MCL2798875.1 lytic transglycosylase domain-containing protein [Endomicrobiia bacterium]